MQKLQLSIPEPCHENWQSMTPTDQGRFCKACAKEVIDFSMMTDTEVLNYFTSLTHDQVCGRALPSQLERTISKPKDPKKRLFWYWNYIVMFFMFFGKGNGAKAQGGIKKTTCMQTVTAADIDIIKSTNVNNALAGKVAGSYSRIIKGKVTDKDGIPVSFASVKVNSSPTGVSADANGEYSIKANSNAILVISGAGFKTVQLPVGTRTVVNIVMENSGLPLKEVVVTVAGGVMRRPVRKEMTESKDTTRIIKSTVIFEVKEDNTCFPIDKAAITITRKGDNLSDKSFSDKKGIYEFKQIKLNDSYFIKVEADGYEPNEFIMDAKDIKDREKHWEILLIKQKIEIIKPSARRTIALGGIVAVNKSIEPIYVIDGLISPSGNTIKPEDVEEISILKGAEATAIYGTQASNGAVIITTRKAKEIKMKEVLVTSYFGIKRTTRCGGVRYTNIYKDSLLSDTIATVKTVLTNSMKIYPNPVQRNSAFSVALQLKQAGNYSLQVTDASGRILLLQKFNAGSKDHTEKITSDSRWAGGIYYIRVFDAQNKLVSKSSFLVQ